MNTNEKRIKLDILHSFGSLCQQGLRDSVSIIDDDNRRILYPVGKFFALKEFDSNKIDFIKVQENVEQIICMAVSPNRKLLALSEKIRKDDFPQISIYNIKEHLTKGEKEKTYRYTDTQSIEFIALSFSGGDARFLVCLTNQPDFMVLFLDYHRMKPSGYTKLSCFQQSVNPNQIRLTINPKENHMIGLTGPNVCKLLRVQENSFKPLNEILNLDQNQEFTDHAWYEDGTIIVANNKGEINIVENFEVIQFIENGFNDKNKTEGVQAIATFSKGFILGSEHGQFALWIKQDENDEKVQNQDFYLQRLWSSQRKSPIQCINISSTSEDLVAVSFRSNDIATFEMSKVLPSTAEATGKHFKITKEIKFDFLYKGFHCGPITAMDVCLQRPLIVTACRNDSTIRIWNYRNFKCELARYFQVGDDDKDDLKSLYSVSFHPTGYYIAAGFIDKLRFFFVLHNELKPFKEIVQKKCTLIQFSKGGQYLAAAYPVNPRQNASPYNINIYNSYTAVQLIVLKGHASIIKSLVWGNQDAYLLSTGHDGGLYKWVYKSESESWDKDEKIYNNSKFTSLIVNPQNHIYLCGTESDKNNVIREKKNENDKSISTDKTKIVQLGYLTSYWKQNAIIGGTLQGQIKVYSSALFTPVPYDTLSAHAGEVSKIRQSPCGRYLFTAGQDGVLFIFSVMELSAEGKMIAEREQDNMDDVMDNDKGGNNMNEYVADKDLADVVLVPRHEIDQYLNDLRNLGQELDNLNNKMEDAKQEEKKILEKQKKEAEEKMNIEITGWSKRYEQLKAQKIQTEREADALRKAMEQNHEKAVDELENLYEKKLAFENEKYLQLEQELLEQKIKHDKVNKEMEKNNVQRIEILNQEFHDKFKQAQGAYDSTKSTANELKRTYEEKLTQQEEEHEMEINDFKDRHKKEVENLNKEKNKLKSENDALKENNKRISDSMQTIEKASKEMQQQMENLKTELQDYKQKINTLQKEIEELNETIKKKEKKIYEYKYKISDLQKSKHVLSFRTTEMRKSLEPKEAQIEKLKEELFKLEGEFEGMLKTSQMQNDKMKKMQNQIDSLTKNLERETEQTKKKENYINQMQMDIYNCVMNKDIKEWPQQMKIIYQKYVLKNDVKPVLQDKKGIEEMTRQVKHLENSIDQMHESSQKIILRRELDIKKKTMENAGLIFNLNEIRKKNKKLESDQNELRNQNDRLKKENKKVIQQLDSIQQQQQQSGAKDDSMSQGGLGQSQQISQQPPLQKLNQSQQQQQQQQQQSFQQEKKDDKQNYISLVPLSHKQRQDTFTGSLVPKGKIYKGSNFDARTLNTFDKAKMMDLMIELESSTLKLRMQDQEIQTLKGKIRKHVQDKGCQELSIDEEDDQSGAFQDNKNQL